MIIQKNEISLKYYQKQFSKRALFLCLIAFFLWYIGTFINIYLEKIATGFLFGTLASYFNILFLSFAVFNFLHKNSSKLASLGPICGFLFVAFLAYLMVKRGTLEIVVFIIALLLLNFLSIIKITKPA